MVIQQTEPPRQRCSASLLHRTHWQPICSTTWPPHYRWAVDGRWATHTWQRTTCCCISLAELCMRQKAWLHKHRLTSWGQQIYRKIRCTSLHSMGFRRSTSRWLVLTLRIAIITDQMRQRTRYSDDLITTRCRCTLFHIAICTITAGLILSFALQNMIIGWR